MNKIMTIAVREYRAMVATKAFLISITMMPILMFGSIVAMQYLQKFDSVKDRTIKIIDGSGKLFEPLTTAAVERTESIKAMQEYAKKEKEASPENKLEEDPAKKRFNDLKKNLRDRKLSNITLELVKAPPTPELRLELSNQIRDGELYAFVEIPSTVFDIPQAKVEDMPKLIAWGKKQNLQILFPKFEVKGGKVFLVHGGKQLELPREVQDEMQEAGLKSAAKLEPTSFYAANPSFSDERNWMESVINNLIRDERLKQAGISQLRVQQASIKAPFKGMALVTMSATGEIQPGKEVDRLTAIFLPMGMMLLMFMVIFMAAQPMLESVIEEKSERIAEVLLGCANPFQLMAGKLLGSVGGSLSILLIYMVGGYFLLENQGWADKIPLHVVPWFLLYQCLAVLLFSSAFMAVGAAVTQTKEAQALLLPIWMVMMLPMFVWFNVIREPNGAMAVGLSFFPPATPMMMVMRMGTGTPIPIWQYIATSFVLLISTAFCLFVAGRIFRVGMLWQGKIPKVSELIRWAWNG